MLKSKKLWIWVGFILGGAYLMAACQPIPCTDNDGDGYGSVASTLCTYPQADCNDEDPTIHPGAEGPEGDATCSDGVDNNCNDLIDDDDVSCLSEMAIIPATPVEGFEMGDHFAEGSPNELPVHPVYVSSFQMDRTEVTNAAYDDDPSGDNHPVTWVTWDEASDYCASIGKRLPTEAEWEYAARGGLVGARYPWGDEDSGDMANFPSLAGSTKEVGSYPPNGYGLFDMAGNVEEYVFDRYKFSDEEPLYNYYQDCLDEGIVVDPQGAPFPDSTWTVVRGGSYAIMLSGDGRVSDRRIALGGNGAFELSTNTGFRCAQDLPE